MDTDRSRRVASAVQWDFFVSYTGADRKWAEWIAWQLEDADYRVLVQAWDMVPGSNWSAKMQDGITYAARTIAVLSEAYIGSVYGRQEWQAATVADPEGIYRKLVPIRIEDCARPGLLGQVVSFDLFGLTPSDARTRLLATVSATVAGRAKPTSEPEFPVSSASPSPVSSSSISSSDARSTMVRRSATTRDRATMLATWNPARWDWDDYADAVQATSDGRLVHEPWSTGRRKSGLDPGDRVFLLIQGNGARGIIGRGTCVSSVFSDAHWDEDRADDANYVLVDWDTLILPEYVLKRAVLIDQIPTANKWRPQASGTILTPEAAIDLEQLWEQHIAEIKASMPSRISPSQNGEPSRNERKSRRYDIAETAQGDGHQARSFIEKVRRISRRASR